MRLRTRLNLVLTGVTAVFVAVLLADEIRDARSSVREEIEAANRVAAHVLESLILTYAASGGTPAVRTMLEQLGHVRANDLTLLDASGKLLYYSPPPVYKVGREAPAWFTHLLAPAPARQVFTLGDGAQVVIAAQPSRAILDAWDDLARLLAIAAVMLVSLGGLAFWLVDRALAPFPVIAEGLERLQRGELGFRLPPLPGSEAHAIGAAFNRMAQAMEDKVLAEREAREARTRLEEGRELALLVEQSVEEERHLIAHELHDEFGQSVTAIRSLAVAIATQSGEPAISDTARLISDEAARLYDAMHGLIPRLAPPSLDTLGLAEALESLVRDWQRRHPSPRLSLRHQLPSDLGTSVTLAAYRVVQEGLVNAVRHSRAQQVTIDVSSTDGRMIVSVTDDGVGLPENWSRPGHFGLRGLAERVEHVGGSLQVRNREPRGACLRAEIPLAAGT
ncbi:MAG TPA: ATP-binding protein [Steroidobacteraceae bacterium]|jgi:two-component system sensor histidine kinase UhpB|nr:ATP-binding protein [Steroidobacteraceae bacterium]